MTTFIKKFKGMFKQDKDNVKVGDIISYENDDGIIEYARLNKVDSIDVWANNWVTDINEVDNLDSNKRVDVNNFDQRLSISSIKEVFKKGKSKKTKLSPVQAKFLNNKRKRIIEEINSNKNYRSCFKDINKEVSSWSSDTILNWKMG